MRLSSLFINRPVLSIVVNVAIMLFGFIGISRMGVRDYPDVDPPVISVSTSYSGASADVIETQITEPLEESINGVAGIRTITSSSADGSSSITVEFTLGTDLEAAANDVRDRVSRAMRNLPPDANTPVVTKADANSSPVIMVTVRSDTRNLLDLTDYSANVLKERLQTIAGVSEVRIWGERRYAMRLWMDPAKMAARAVTPQDVKNAIDRENVELPSGSIAGATTELSIRTMSGMRTADEFNTMVISETNGTVVRFRDIGEAVEEAENDRTIMKRNGVPMVGVAIIPQPGANHIAIADEFYLRLKNIERDKPADVLLEIGYDVTKNIRTSIVEVVETIALAFMLVVLVIFTFFRNWRATMIPMLAMPISLTGAFFIMYIFGFSVNILTLLALVLATGLVVDDAIVVLENIYNKIERGVPPLEAGHSGSSEIFFAIIATTMALVAVLFPVILLQGVTGKLFKEFGGVLSGSVFLSAIVSLSITPMLCTRFLKHHISSDRSLYSRTEPYFEALITAYRRTLERFMHRRFLAFVVIVFSLCLIALFFTILPTELAPFEDRSRVFINATASEGRTFEYMRDYMDKVDVLINKTVPEKDAALTRTPGGNSGSVTLLLVDPAKRKASQQEIVNRLAKAMQGLSGARAIVSQEQTIGGRGAGLPVQFVIQAPELDDLKEKLPLFLQEASKDPCFQAVDANMKFNKPELRLSIDREKARDLGVSARDIAQSLQLAMSGSRYGYYIRNGKQYQIIGQFSRENRARPLDLTSAFVRSKTGGFVQLDNMVTLTETSSPPQLYRFNRFSAATVSDSLAEGRTLGEGITVMRAIAKKTLDDRFQTALAGTSRDFSESGSSIVFAFLFALVLVFLVLAAQFESFRHPLIVMFTVPMAIAGALFTLWYFNQSLNIFSQIGIIMLIGLVTKNGILIVEFTNQRRRAGMAAASAIIEGAVSRFRPIVMTSLTVMLGSLPIALALGSGAKSRMSMGIAIIGGLAFSLILSLFVIPAMYSFLAGKETAGHSYSNP